MYNGTMNLAAFYRRVGELLSSGTRFGCARLVEAKGSVPQTPSASLILYPDGSFEGTIGGGRFEAQVLSDLLAMIESDERIDYRRYGLNRNELQMFCAGEAHVLLETFRAGSELLVFGGGHVGEALAKLAREVGGFSITVVDDRATYADPKRHPRAHATAHTDASYTDNMPTLGPGSYVVLVTRCHDVDRILCKRFAVLDLAYLGMIGSKAKAASFRKLLLSEGISEEHIARIHMPIGLDLGPTKRPNDVALSILAEVVKVRQQREQGKKERTP